MKIKLEAGDIERIVEKVVERIEDVDWNDNYELKGLKIKLSKSRRLLKRILKWSDEEEIKTDILNTFPCLKKKNE